MRGIIVLCCSLALNAHAGIFSARVLAVIDGDTVLVLRENGQKLKVRLANIDAPEVGHTGTGDEPSIPPQPYGEQSRQSLRTLLGKKHVQVDSRAVDRYGRIIAVVSADGVIVNQAQVKRGYAWAGARAQGSRRADRGGQAAGKVQAEDGAAARDDRTYSSLQNEARQDGRGLWAEPNPQAPWLWRKQHPLQFGTQPEQPGTHDHAAPDSPDSGQCGSKTRCAQMTSCEEARYYFTHCGLKSLDFNGDGEPCESVCSGKRRHPD